MKRGVVLLVGVLLWPTGAQAVEHRVLPKRQANQLFLAANALADAMLSSDPEGKWSEMEARAVTRARCKRPDDYPFVCSVLLRYRHDFADPFVRCKASAVVWRSGWRLQGGNCPDAWLGSSED